ncbi:mRNA-degrading endonuclease RelE of RelBE toxin-antitoxin system [Hephaestia caeni]|uniref:mRNA-degrading endonuclease RelE of RelBE toxin-antitoxin system n=1 Tax=Hephaestia caeni TaxID=645617 RepID=A0A397NL02_9SPHN|nr:type II toxin-antitoxin system RelE/ParE family toxin [Hephaestia caeni]RIA35375.1 mRNA-degrading endonuclease RelE of RelBE toxin-antitoxin system [Hephaestia caeni]
MGREVTYTKAALKALVRMPANASKLIRSKVTQYAAAPDALANNVTTMKGGSGYVRMRVGDWRVIMDADTMTVLVIDIGPRGGIYD